jgi:BED zinc finger
VRSNVWEHYSLIEEKGVRFAVCKVCAKNLKQAKNAGTGTLRNHILAHSKVRSASAVDRKHQTTIKIFQGKPGPSSTFYASLDSPSPNQREKLVLWMVRRNIPFADVEDFAFRDFMFSMNPNVKLMSRSSACGDIVKLYEKMRPIIAKRISRIPGGICVSVDGWTSECQKRNYIGIVITFIEHWERKSVRLSLVSTDHESHTGEVLANLVYAEMKRFNIHTKLFAMASDKREQYGRGVAYTSRSLCEGRHNCRRRYARTMRLPCNKHRCTRLLKKDRSQSVYHFCITRR